MRRDVVRDLNCDVNCSVCQNVLLNSWKLLVVKRFPGDTDGC